MTTATEIRNATKKIEAEFASQIIKGCGAVVEVTNRDGRKWTVSGLDAEVRMACKFLVSHLPMRVESIDRDEELSETFAYLTA